MTDYVMITPATATRGSLYCTCLGHLVRYDINRIINICVMSPKVAKASTVVTVTCRWRWRYHPKLCQWKYAFSSSFLGLLCCIYTGNVAMQQCWQKRTLQWPKLYLSWLPESQKSQQYRPGVIFTTLTYEWAQ